MSKSKKSDEKSKPEKPKRSKSKRVDEAPVFIDAPVAVAETDLEPPTKIEEPYSYIPAPVDPIARPKIPKGEEDPVGFPILKGDKFERCSDGCGRIADTLGWDDRAPYSLRCFGEQVLKSAFAYAAEKSAKKDAQNKNLERARAIARGEEIGGKQ